MDIALLAARLLLAVVFAVAAVTKLLDRPGTRRAVAEFGVPEGMTGAVSLALPAAELLTMAALVPAALARWGAAGALLLLLLFLAGIAFNLARGKTPDCHCFGQLYSEPIGTGTIVRNAILGLIALFILIGGYGRHQVDALAWLRGLSAVEGLALLLAVLAVLAAAAQWWLLLHPPLWLADRLPILGGAGTVEKPAPRAEMTPLPDGAEPQPGLPVGSPAPRFRLPGLYGEIMTLDALRAGGRAVVLVFVSPTCGPCSALMPELARWQVEYAGALRFVLISSGTPEDNRAKAGEHGITEILLQKGFEVGTVYGIGGTPSAVIIHPSGVIGSPVAGGAPQIRALLDRYVELLADQVGVELEDEGEFERAEREAANPFVIGAPAPDLALSDLAGRTVTLAGFRGRDVAVLFWSTTCSFCRQMEPVLRAWEADRPAGAPDLLLVLDTPPGDGQAPHLQSPVLIDHERAAAVALHCTGTPTAVLVDARGAIASQPALGQDAIRPLLGLPPAAPPIRLQDQAPPRPVTTPAQRGVSAGAAAPNVEVTTLRGGTLQLADLRGRETILLFWSSAEEACRRLEPDLTAWETGAAPDAPDLMVVVPGSTAGSQVIRFGADVVIDRDGSAAAAFGVDRMPAAVLVDAQGNVAAEPAVGGPHVLQLLQRTSPETAPAGG